MRGEKLVDAWVEHAIYTYYEPEWEKLIQKAVWKELKVKEQLDENLSVRLEFFLTKNRYESRLDLDNMIKTVIDSLNADEHEERTEYPIYDDSWVMNIEATKIASEEKDNFHKEKTHIEIWKWNH